VQVLSSSTDDASLLEACAALRCIALHPAGRARLTSEQGLDAVRPATCAGSGSAPEESPLTRARGGVGWGLGRRSRFW
jgi:hypothetical protein